MKRTWMTGKLPVGKLLETGYDEVGYPEEDIDEELKLIEIISRLPVEKNPKSSESAGEDDDVPNWIHVVVLGVVMKCLCGVCALVVCLVVWWERV